MSALQWLERCSQRLSICNVYSSKTIYKFTNLTIMYATTFLSILWCIYVSLLYMFDISDSHLMTERHFDLFSVGRVMTEGVNTRNFQAPVWTLRYIALPLEHCLWVKNDNMYFSACEILVLMFCAAQNMLEEAAPLCQVIFAVGLVD